ncbi:MAG: hypothetical protein EOS08_16160 [Mesorhizobium sp.]|nr:MAG: hypothetical protein EOS08_16160 [Mesorhizobium sp.]
MINMTLKQLLATVATGVVLLGAALWVVLAFTLNNLKSDVSDIRVALTQTQDRNADTHQNATAADGDLRAQLAILTAELKVTNAGLTNLAASVGGLDESLKAVDARLAASVLRQEGFERWVVTRLGKNETMPTATPLEWQKAEGEIIDALKVGDEPLTGWYKFIQR